MIKADQLSDQSAAEAVTDAQGCSTDSLLSSYKTDASYRQEGRIYVTLRGDKARSKAEMMIADALFLAGIQYIYEPRMVFNGVVYHPDFLILSPFSNKLLIWEHLGMFDDQEYQHRAARKLEDYFAEAFLPGVNLILTYESKTMKLDSQTIEDIIQRLFAESI
ncbi:MAG: hypothetical protein IJH77_05770 [Mogibacterium sp.]|nr:hypothetical protein [Mogibacterium sp.]